MIELKNITKTFHQKGRSIQALSEVSIHVEKGKIFGVVGASGAGKSTLIRCVNLLEQPSSGHVIVDGENLSLLPRKELAAKRKSIGMIFQHFNLLSSRTVFENIAFPLELDHLPKSEIKERVLDLLKLVGLEEKQHDYPSSLSGGQKQRVAIARTLANHPHVLLCDEATSALDPATTSSILKLLKDINERLNITILLITHEMEVVKHICDEVAIMSGGTVVEQGTVKEVFSNPKSDLAREFLSSTLKIEIPKALKDKLVLFPYEGKRPLLKLVLNGESSTHAIFSDISHAFKVEADLVTAQIEDVGGAKFGTMLVVLLGSSSQLEEAILYLQAKNIKTEVLGYV
ncbi:methionine ABC transporter ATP-binding protein [Pedobacter sp. ASV28]|uniref:methionine ABC transporter ATP-binding protein n=1 Tax=Pedobacter sp. ASV28 TaxID=2795123 RepID=UPI0018EBAEF5|nr:methionine ABC transporter ATP-binding protein [Pedobacter sp. ASV28]